MSNIELVYVPGRIVNVVIHYNGQVWNKDTEAFVDYDQADWAHYAMPMSEQTSSGYYFLEYPSAIPEGTLSTEVMYQQNSASPTLPALPGGDTYLSIGQSQGTNVQNISGSGSAAVSLGASAQTIIRGTAQTGTLSTTQMSTDLTNTHANAYNGRVVIWTSGVLTGQASVISAYTVAGGILTFAAKTNAPANGDTFVIV
jgi:hypothetical protein